MTSQDRSPHEGRPRGIVWIASYPRSGGVWVRVFLAALLDLLERGAEGEAPSPAALGYDDNQGDLYETVLRRRAGTAQPHEIAAVRPDVLQGILSRNDGLVPVGTHSANISAFGVPVIEPRITAGAVYIVRNPLDVAVAFAQARGVDIDAMIDDLALSGFSSETTDERVATLTGSWTENVATWTAKAHPALLVLRYEDLVAEPLEAFGMIAEHVRMTPTPELLEKAVERASFDHLRTTVNGGDAGVAGEVLRNAGVGIWREALSPEQVERVVSAHREQMTRFEYLPLEG